QVTAHGPARALQRLLEHRAAGDRFRIVLGQTAQHADEPHPACLLRARRERPRGCAAEQCDELAPRHSITSSARKSTTAGNVRPRSPAVLRFKTNSNLVGVSIGVTAGFAPSKTLAAMTPCCRITPSRLGPYAINPPFRANSVNGVMAGSRCLSARSASNFVGLPVTVDAN